jgi:hypothetical protein
MQDSNSGSDEECDLQTLGSATAFSCYPILMSINIRTITIQILTLPNVHIPAETIFWISACSWDWQDHERQERLSRLSRDRKIMQAAQQQMASMAKFK